MGSGKGQNKTIHQTNNHILETIPEEVDLPRIQKLIPKSPETMEREQEFWRLCEENFKDQKLEQFYERLLMNDSINRLYLSNKYYPSNRKGC